MRLLFRVLDWLLECLGIVFGVLFLCDEPEDDYQGREVFIPVIDQVRSQETPSAQFARRMEAMAESMNSVPRVDEIDRDFYIVFGGE